MMMMKLIILIIIIIMIIIITIAGIVVSVSCRRLLRGTSENYIIKTGSVVSKPQEKNIRELKRPEIINKIEIIITVVIDNGSHEHKQGEGIQFLGKTQKYCMQVISFVFVASSLITAAICLKKFQETLWNFVR